MVKVIPFNDNSSQEEGDLEKKLPKGLIKKVKERKSTFINNFVYGTPYQFEAFGRTVQMVGGLYRVRKMREFFEEYWPYFVQNINEIDSNQEFDVSVIAHKYNSLDGFQKVNLHLECADIYAFHGKLTYAQFFDAVNSYTFFDKLEDESGFSPNGAA